MLLAQISILGAACVQVGTTEDSLHSSRELAAVTSHTAMRSPIYTSHLPYLRQVVVVLLCLPLCVSGNCDEDERTDDISTRAAILRLAFGLVFGGVMALCSMCVAWLHIHNMLEGRGRTYSGSYAAELSYLLMQCSWSSMITVVELCLWVPSLALQLQHVPDRTFWSGWAASLGKYTGQAAFQVLYCYVILWYFGRTRADQLVHREFRENHPSTRHDLCPAEKQENKWHTRYAVVQLIIFIALGIGFTALFFAWLWPWFEFYSGCRNTIRMFSVWLAMMVAVVAAVVPGSVLLVHDTVNGERRARYPAVEFIDGKREYRLVNTLKVVGARTVLEMIFSGLEVWSLIQLVKENVSPTTFWLAWGGSVAGNIGIYFELWNTRHTLHQDDDIARKGDGCLPV